ncbi:transposase [Metasolibacillus sp. FSL H7-0170]|uniref:transposase n=1 Tax=Metasolibacillus sp. FSL H7-0170 TaxID=2921431 RepID=UPI003157FFBB
MNQFTTEIVDALVKKPDITEVFRSHLEMAIISLLATDLTEFLYYEKYDRIGFNSGNSRNGSYSRTLHTEYGDLAIQIPHDRNGEFKQQTVAPYKRSNDTLEDTVIHLFKKEITMSEIAHLIEKMHGHHYTPQTISNMIKAGSETVEAFNKQIKKYTKRKEQFPNEKSMERFLVTQFEDYNQRFATRCHIGFNQARAPLEEMFEQLHEPVN